MLGDAVSSWYCLRQSGCATQVSDRTARNMSLANGKAAGVGSIAQIGAEIQKSSSSIISVFHLVAVQEVLDYRAPASIRLLSKAGRAVVDSTATKSYVTLNPCSVSQRVLQTPEHMARIHQRSCTVSSMHARLAVDSSCDGSLEIINDCLHFNWLVYLRALGSEGCLLDPTAQAVPNRAFSLQ